MWSNRVRDRVLVFFYTILPLPRVLDTLSSVYTVALVLKGYCEIGVPVGYKVLRAASSARLLSRKASC
jgi:hypothetical protein